MPEKDVGSEICPEADSNRDRQDSLILTIVPDEGKDFVSYVPIVPVEPLDFPVERRALSRADSD
jgi:hypothetical protein